MKLTRKSDYALRALVTLAVNYGQGPVPNRELAEQNDIPKRFLEQIRHELKAKGWVTSSPGLDGGFELGVRLEDHDDEAGGPPVRWHAGTDRLHLCQSL